MEMEHINENLIKVLIGPEDLEERGIDFLDLIGDQSSIEKFFYSILEEVDVDKHFQGSEAVTFQVMPNQDGLELYISRTNFDDIDEMWEDELTKHLIERKKQWKDKSKQEEKAIKGEKGEDFSALDNWLQSQADKESQSTSDLIGEIIRFNEFHDFVKLAREIPTDLIQADLYHMGTKYFMVIKEIDESIKEEMAYNKFLAMLEYGEKFKTTVAFLGEHGKLIREDDTLEYFGTNI